MSRVITPQEQLNSTDEYIRNRVDTDDPDPLLPRHGAHDENMHELEDGRPAYKFVRHQVAQPQRYAKEDEFHRFARSYNRPESHRF